MSVWRISGFALHEYALPSVGYLIRALVDGLPADEITESVLCRRGACCSTKGDNGLLALTESATLRHECLLDEKHQDAPRPKE